MLSGPRHWEERETYYNNICKYVENMEAAE